MDYFTKYFDLRFKLLDLADKAMGTTKFDYWYGHYKKLHDLCIEKDKE